MRSKSDALMRLYLWIYRMLWMWRCCYFEILLRYHKMQLLSESMRHMVSCWRQNDSPVQLPRYVDFVSGMIHCWVDVCIYIIIVHTEIHDKNIMRYHG